MPADDYEIRISEGRHLAQAIGDAVTNDRLLQLLLDPSDTAVTYETALALLARRDSPGVELILRAHSLADDDTRQWLGDAFLTFRAASLGKDDEFLRSSLRSCVTSSSELRTDAQDLIDRLDL